MADELSSAIASQHARARWTTYLLWICIGLDAAAVGSGLMQRALLSRIAAEAHDHSTAASLLPT